MLITTVTAAKKIILTPGLRCSRSGYTHTPVTWWIQHTLKQNKNNKQWLLQPCFTKVAWPVGLATVIQKAIIWKACKLQLNWSIWMTSIPNRHHKWWNYDWFLTFLRLCFQFIMSSWPVFISDVGRYFLAAFIFLRKPLFRAKAGNCSSLCSKQVLYTKSIQGS